MSTTAAVVTVSDGVAAGTREDAAGSAVTDVLAGAGFEVARREVVPDETERIAALLRELAGSARLVVTTGGTGLGPRDVTPEATRATADLEVPGLAEAMRAAGRRSTPMADLSRGVVGAIGSTLVVNLPGSTRGAVESLEAVLPVLPHALELLAGNTEHRAAPTARSADVLEELTRRRGAGEELVLATAVRTHGDPPCQPGQRLLLGREGPLVGTLGCAEFDGAAVADAPAVMDAGAVQVVTYEHDLGSVEVQLEPHLRQPLLVVLGATPVATWLLRWGRDLGWRTALVESRPGRVTDEHREAADAVVPSVEGVVGDPASDGDLAAVHTDHDAPDVTASLVALLRSRARFVGLMSSARHASGHLDGVRQALGEQEAGRVRTPVGLDLGGRDPREIALAILAGMVADRHGRGGGWLDR